MIDVRRDFVGIRLAAAQLWLESFAQKELQAVTQGAPPEAVAEARAKLIPPRTVSAGYFHWVEYLFWLRSVSALPCAGITLFADETQGLLELALAEDEFRRTHPSCPYCGSLNESFAGACRSCFKELN